MLAFLVNCAMKTGGAVYIVTNKWKNVLYIGVTTDLIRRVSEHKSNSDRNTFTGKYACNVLVYYENHPRIEDAIKREKQLKKWNREWKENLINRFNPGWVDLHDSLFRK